jgi:hypothetical protein
LTTAVRLSESGCIARAAKQPWIVMHGLDPGIHGVPHAQNPEFSTGWAAWMAGSSPAMTI